MITAKTSPKTRAQIGFGIMNGTATADESGNFELKYKLPRSTEEKINILVSLDSKTNSKDIIVKPSAKFAANQKIVVEEGEEADTTNNDNVPSEYKAALRSAKSYGKTMHMSKAGIYDQLISEYGENFPPEAAQYAIDNLTMDWNANALATAKSYRDSTESIREQLVSEYGEKFTPEETEYAVQNLPQ